MTQLCPCLLLIANLVEHLDPRTKDLHARDLRPSEQMAWG